MCIIAVFIWSQSSQSAIHAEELESPSKNDIYISFFDLPDGESTLFQTGRNENILINTGSEKSIKSLLFQLKELSITHIDTLILTKQTVDYCGNATRLADRYNIKQVIYTGELSETCESSVSINNQLKWHSGELHELSEGLFFRVLKAENNGEMSLGIIYGKNSIMYLSNSNLEDEDKLLKYPLDPEILKIGDYARGKSPSADFLSRIDPHISIVFHCEKCSPNEGLIERLNESWVDVYQLERFGTAIIRMNLSDYEILNPTS